MRWRGERCANTAPAARRRCDPPRQFDVLACPPQAASGRSGTGRSQLRAPQDEPRPSIAALQEDRSVVVGPCRTPLPSPGRGGRWRSGVVLDRCARGLRSVGRSAAGQQRDQADGPRTPHGQASETPIAGSPPTSCAVLGSDPQRQSRGVSRASLRPAAYCRRRSSRSPLRQNPAQRVGDRAALGVGGHDLDRVGPGRAEL